MAIPTRKVTIDLYEIVGTALSHGKVRFSLSRSDIYLVDGGGIVADGVFVVDCDEDGKGEIDLFPNELGTQGTHYDVQVFDQYARQVFPEKGMVVATLPDRDSKLHEILYTMPYITQQDADAATNQARIYRDQAEGFANDAAESAQEAQDAAIEVGGAVDDVNNAGAAQVANVNAAGATQVAAVNTAGATQVAAVNTAGANALNGLSDIEQAVDEDRQAVDAAMPVVEQSLAMVLWVGPTPPLNPLPNKEWLNTTNGKTYSWIDDGTSQQWAESAGFYYVDDPVSVTAAQTSAAAALVSQNAAAGSATASAGSAAAALASQTASAASQSSALGSSTQAAAFASQAATARDSAAVIGQMVNTTAEGISITSGSGTLDRFFVVPSASTIGVAAVIYRNDAGVATAISSIVSSSYFGDMNDDPTWRWGIGENNERIFIGVKQDGTVVMNTLEVKNITISGAVTLTGTGDFNYPGRIAPASLRTPKIEVPTNDLGYLPTQMVLDTDSSGEKATRVVNTDGSTEFPAIITKEATADKVTSKQVIAPFSTLHTINGRSTLALTRAALPRFPLRYFAQILHLIAYGQSNSIGTQALPSISTTPGNGYNTLMFNSMRPADTGNVRNVLLPSQETDFGGVWGETVLSGAAYAIRRLMADEYGIVYSAQDFQMLLSAEGVGGKSMNELTDDSYGLYQAIPASITAGKALAEAAGKTYDIRSILMVEGERDSTLGTSEKQFIGYMQAFYDKALASVRTITGIDREFWLVYAQTASHNVAAEAPNIPIAQVNAMATNPFMVCSSSVYQFPHALIDNIHYTNTTAWRVGCHLGIALFRRLFEGKEWLPLFCREATRHGKYALLHYVPWAGNLTFDTSVVSAIANYGFVLRDAARNILSQATAPIMLNGVGPIIRIEASANIPAGAFIDYALDKDASDPAGKSGPADGPRGNLRDQQGDTINFGGWRVDNYALMQRIPFLN